MPTVFEELLGGEELPSLSRKEAIIMRLLVAGAEMYGLEIVERSAGGIGRGTVYVTLSRMQDKGYVDSRQEPVPRGWTGLPRRLYRISGEGQGVLKRYEVAANIIAGRLAT